MMNYLTANIYVLRFFRSYEDKITPGIDLETFKQHAEEYFNGDDNKDELVAYAMYRLEINRMRENERPAPDLSNDDKEDENSRPGQIEEID